MVFSAGIVQEHAQNYGINRVKFDIFGTTANFVRKISLPKVCTNVRESYKKFNKKLLI
jgi:hypothetical protein